MFEPAGDLALCFAKTAAWLMRLGGDYCSYSDLYVERVVPLVTESSGSSLAEDNSHLKNITALLGISLVFMPHLILYPTSHEKAYNGK